MFLLAPSIFRRELGLGDFMQAYDAYVQVALVLPPLSSHSVSRFVFAGSR
jgi:hypothetical protein